MYHIPKCVVQKWFRPKKRRLIRQFNLPFSLFKGDNAPPVHLIPDDNDRPLWACMDLSLRNIAQFGKNGRGVFYQMLVRLDGCVRNSRHFDAVFL